MARCPNCHQLLDDSWLKRIGASLLGQSAKGKAKRRNNSEQLAQARWERRKRNRNPP